MNILKGIGCIAVLNLFAGCASIVSDSEYPVTLSTEPNGATFKLRDHVGRVLHEGQTPQQVILPADRGFFKPAKYEIEFQKTGYYSCNWHFNASIDPWYIGNLLFGGLIGAVLVDPATGAMWELEPVMNVRLQKKP